MIFTLLASGAALTISELLILASIWQISDTERPAWGWFAIAVASALGAMACYMGAIYYV